MGDIFISGESIAALTGKNLDIRADKEIDTAGLWRFPDSSTRMYTSKCLSWHLQQRYHESGTWAALHGAPMMQTISSCRNRDIRF